MRAATPRRAAGFTLVELIMTVVVLAALTAIVGPQVREFLINSTVTSTANDLVVSLNLARAEAVKRGRSVELLVRGNGWTDGWDIQETGTSEVFSGHAELKTGYTINGMPSGAGGNEKRVVFNPEGRLGAGTAFDFNVCRPAFSSDHTLSRRVTVTANGLVSSRRGTAGSPAAGCP